MAKAKTKKWHVYGSVPVSVTYTVEADTMEEAIEKANNDFPGLRGCVGNGGVDKMVGVDDSAASLDVTDPQGDEFDSASEADDDDSE
jgi:hypothetical protein